MANLKARRLEVIDVCCICEEPGESVHHVIRGCRLGRSSLNYEYLEINSMKLFIWVGQSGAIGILATLIWFVNHLWH